MDRSRPIATVVLLLGLVACNRAGRDDASYSPTVSTSSTTAEETGGSTSGGGSISASSGQASSSAQQSSSSSQRGGTHSSSGPVEEDKGFSYTPWGPDDPPIPGQYAALAAAPGKPPRCDDAAAAQPGGAFWSTAVAVCRAIAGAGPWPAKTSVPKPPPAQNAYQACLNGELSAMLKRALLWHAAHPGAKAKVKYPSSASRSPCQSRIYQVRVLGPADVVSGEKPPDGVPLAVTAAGLSGDIAVNVDGVPAEFTSDFDVPDPGDGLRTIVVLTSSPAEARKAKVEVSTDREPLVAYVDLPAAAAASPSPSSDEPSPAASETSS